jgi:hypothetical protein
MKNASRVTTVPLLAFWVLFLAATSWAQARPPIVEKLAKAYGLDSFGQIEQFRYTFNIEFPGFKASRTWTWEPKADRVTYEAKDKDGKAVKVTYVRSQLSSQPDNVKNEIDPGFVNDNYWVIYPFHAYWDTSASVKDAGMQKLPIRKGSAEHVLVKYPSEGGYTPGDTWELFVGLDTRVHEFIYRRGGPKKPSVVTATWAGYKQAGPLLISTEHVGTADGKPLRLVFSDVAVKLTGSNAWVDAK